MQFLLCVCAIAAALGNTGTATPVPNSDKLPIVDLGYARHQASSFNTTGQYFNFSNVAYAQPPLGSLRFVPPKPPHHTQGVQNGGQSPRMCPQGTPEWLALVLAGKPDVPVSPYESEDCLYLDVFVPEKIFQQNKGKQSGAPVMVWIHGGGWVLGSKTDHNPAGLVARGMEHTNSDGVILVALNYRLGSFGFLAGSEFVSESGTSNAGLLDQRLALEWVQQNIHNFGGDAERVTVVGESAGASSIAHHIAADKEPSFQQAIIQSPAELPLLTNAELNDQLQTWLTAANASSLSQARAMDTSVLQRVNRNIIKAATYGQFVYGPAFDGKYVLDIASKQLRAGHPNPDLKLMTAHNSNEGSLFTLPPSNITETFDFTSYVDSVLGGPTASQSEHVVNVLYPPPSANTSYSTQYERAVQFVGDFYVDCNAYGINRVYNGKPYAYRFSVPPGYHTQDVDYTFYNGDSATVNATVALAMQTFFVNFAAHGDPNAARFTSPQMPESGHSMQFLNLTDTAFEVASDPMKNIRCEYWTSYRSACQS